MDRYRCIKPIDGYEVGQIYGTDIFGWVINGIDRCSFDMDKFEKVND